MSEEFKRMQVSSELFYETNDCAVIAVALAARVPYATAHSALEEAGRKRRRGTKMAFTLAVLKRFGMKVSPLRLFKVRTQSTVLAELPPRGTFLVRTRSRIFCVRDGTAHDSAWANRRRTKVRDVMEILSPHQVPMNCVSADSPPKPKRGEVGKTLRELIKANPSASAAQIVSKLRAKFPESKADTVDVSVMRSRMKKEGAL